MSDVATLQDALALIGERAGSAAQAGRLDEQIVDALRASGVHRTLLPAVFGGREANPCELYETIAQIGAVDGSTAWCGILTIGMRETLKLFRSVRPVGTTDRSEGRRAVRAFNAFFMREQLALLRQG